MGFVFDSVTLRAGFEIPGTAIPGSWLRLIAENQRGERDTAEGVFTVLYPQARVRVDTLAGTGGLPGFRDGPARDAMFAFPRDVAVLPDGRILVSEQYRIRAITPDGNVVTVVGNGEAGFADGEGGSARVTRGGLGRLAGGAAVFADCENQRVREISGNTIRTIAGSGLSGFVDGPGPLARFDCPEDAALAPDGSIWVSDRNNHAIRRIRPDGQVETVAGDGMPGESDGPAGAGRLNTPHGIVVDANGVAYVIDESGLGALRRALPDGTVETLTRRTLDTLKPADGPVEYVGPPSGLGVAVGVGDVLYVNDEAARRVRRVSSDWRVAAVHAAEGAPVINGLAVDRDGNVILVETGENRVIKISFLP